MPAESEPSSSREERQRSSARLSMPAPSPTLPTTSLHSTASSPPIWSAPPMHRPRATRWRRFESDSTRSPTNVPRSRRGHSRSLGKRTRSWPSSALSSGRPTIGWLRWSAAMERRAERQAAAQVVPWNGVIPEGPTRYAAPAIAAALSKLGSTYVWGAAGPDNLRLQRTDAVVVPAGRAGPAARLERPVERDHPGAPEPDGPWRSALLLLRPARRDTIHHVAMYIGNGQMVHAPRTGDVVDRPGLLRRTVRRRTSWSLSTRGQGLLSW